MQTYDSRNHDTFAEARRLEMKAQMLRAEAVVDTFLGLGRFIARLVSPVTGAMRRLSDALGRQREADRIYSELSRMSDRDLSDIGISRSDIPAIADGKFARAAAPAGEVVVLRAKTPEETEAASAELDRAA